MRGHGEGSIFQRKNGRWVGEISLEDHTRKQFYGKTKKEVQEKVRQAINEQKQGMLAIGPQQTIKQYLEKWYEDVHSPVIHVSTRVKHRSHLDKYILPTLGHIKLQKLKAEQVQALYAKMTKEGLSASIVRSTNGVLHKALDNAVRWGLVMQNVCDRISVPRQTRYHAQTLTSEQAKKLLEVARGHRLEVLLTVALTTGMRRGELLGLKWQDIDLETGSLQIRRSVTFMAKHGFVVSEPKTEGSRRNITLPPFIIEMLQKHRTRQSEMRFEVGNMWEEHGLVFCNTLGSFQEPNYMLNLFRKLLEDAGLPHMRFHDLRHSAATMLLTMGVHPKVVQELLGHSQISMTMDTYSHVLPSMQREAIDKLGGLFRN